MFFLFLSLFDCVAFHSEDNRVSLYGGAESEGITVRMVLLCDRKVWMECNYGQLLSAIVSKHCSTSH